SQLALANLHLLAGLDDFLSRLNLPSRCIAFGNEFGPASFASLLGVLPDFFQRAKHLRETLARRSQLLFAVQECRGRLFVPRFDLAQILLDPLEDTSGLLDRFLAVSNALQLFFGLSDLPQEFDSTLKAGT